MQAMADDRESFMDIVRDEGERRRAEYGEPGLNPRQRREIQGMIYATVDKAVGHFIKNVKTTNGRIDRVADALIGVMENDGRSAKRNRPVHPDPEGDDGSRDCRRTGIPSRPPPLPHGPYGMGMDSIQSRLESAGILRGWNDPSATPAGYFIHYFMGALHRRRGFDGAHSLPGPMGVNERKAAEMGFDDEDRLMAAEVAAEEESRQGQMESDNG